MKRVILLCSFLWLLPFAAAQQLPKLAVPENYKISFAPDFQNDNFAGEETIQVRVLKTTSEIVLNSAEIKFQEAKLTSNGTVQKARVSFQKENETATLAFDHAIAPGPATLHITYSGILNDELRGLYLGKDAIGEGKALSVDDDRIGKQTHGSGVARSKRVGENLAPSRDR